MSHRAFQPNAFQNNAFQVGDVTPPFPAEGLAQLYGGGALHEGRRKKKKEEEEPSIEVMVRAIANETGAQEVIRVLPKRAQAVFPDPQLAIISELVKQVQQGSERLKRDITRLYEEQAEEEEDMLLLAALGKLERKTQRRPLQQMDDEEEDDYLMLSV